MNHYAAKRPAFPRASQTLRRLTLCLSLLLGFAPGAHADDTEVFINPVTAASTPNLLFVMDLSGSMNRKPDGNFPANNTEQSRLDILKIAIDQLITSDLDDINIGLMNFSGTRQHGIFFPTLGIEDDASTFDADIPNGQTVGETINSIIQAASAGGNTPTVPALYEAARYLRGENVEAGGLGNFGDWDENNGTYTGGDFTAPNPIAHDNSNQYISPITQQCQNTAILLLTDGQPTRNNVDFGSLNGDGTARNPRLIRELIASDQPGVSVNDVTCADQSVLFGAGPNGYRSPNCGIELAEHLNQNPQRSNIIGSNITTSTIGFGLTGPGSAENTAFLERISTAGGGTAYLADDLTSLVESFNDVIDSIGSQNQSFRNFSATFDVATLSTGDRAYLSLFRPEVARGWTGNLKGFFLRPDGLYDVNDNPATEFDEDGQIVFRDTSRSFWSSVIDGNDPERGGLVGTLTPANRNLYVVTDVNDIANLDLNNGNFNLDANNAGLTTDLMGMPAGSTDEEREALIDFTRSARMGDPLHTRPQIVDYGGSLGRILFLPTNQGFLHAMDINRPTGVEDVGGGNELFAFMPIEVVGNLQAQSRDSSSGGHIYGIDGEVTIWRQDLDQNGEINGNDKVYLYFGMRRGGSVYYALDITNPNDPQVLWKIDNSVNGFSRMGQTWSKMTLADVRDGTTDRKVLVFTGGYDLGQDDVAVARDPNGDDVGLGVYIVDPETGALLKSIGPDGSFGFNPPSLEDMKYAISSDVRVVDTDANGIDDRLYFADLGGQIWRIDIREDRTLANNGKYSGYKLADFGLDAAGNTTAASNRRFFFAPSIARGTVGGDFVFTLSIGSGYRAHPLDDTIEDKVFLFHDPNAEVGAPQTTPTAFTLNSLYDATDDLITVGDTDEQVLAQQSLDTANGWFISLAPDEKVLARTRLFRNRLLLTSFQPEISTDPCSLSETTNRLYVLDIASGSGSFPIDTNNDGTIDDEVRSQVVADQALILDEPLIVTYQDEGSAGGGEDGEPPRPPQSCAGIYGGAQQLLTICSAPVKVNWTTLQ